MGRAGLPATLKRPGASRWRAALLRLAVSGAVLAAVVSWIDVDRARHGFEELDWAPWVLALGGFLSLHAASAIKWRYMLSLAGVRIGARRAVTCHAAGLFANLCLPSLIGGDVLRAGLAMRGSHRRTSVVVGSVVDRFADLVALLLLVAVGLLGVTEPTTWKYGSALLMVALGFAAVGGLLAVGALRRVTSPNALRRFPRKLARRLVDLARALRQTRRNPVGVLLGFAACVTIQTGFVLLNVRLGHAVGLHMDVSVWLLLWPLAKIAAMVPVSLGGLGVREAAFAALVSPVGPEALAVVQSLVWQSVLICGGLLCGAYWLLFGKSSSTTTEPAG